MEVNINGIDLILKRISNVELFDLDSQLLMPLPKVPTFFIKEQNREIENPDHPLYHTALSVYFTNKMMAFFTKLIQETVTIKDKNDIKLPKNLRRTYPNLTDEFLFLRHIVFNDQEAQDRLVNNVVLTETRVHKVYSKIRILRGGIELEQHDLTNVINTNIQTEPIVVGSHQIVHPLDEYNACVSSNINWYEWQECKLSLDFMADTIALYRINKLVNMHSEDAQQIEAKRKTR